LTWGAYPDTHGPTRRALRVEYPGAIYHVMDRRDRREDIFIIGTAKRAKSVLHRSGRGQHQHKPARADPSCAQLEFQSTVFTADALLTRRNILGQFVLSSRARPRTIDTRGQQP
jgi:hypothetical protein